MSLLRVSKQTPIQLQLRRDLVRSVKRGHSWIYADALRTLPQTQRGVSAILLDNRGGREVGRGYYDPQGRIALRVCTTQRGEALTDYWAAKRMRRALSLRHVFFDGDTTAYRLFNGEGDGLPGLVCDRYADTAVISLDGEAARKFWDAPGIARWLVESLGLRLVYERLRGHNASSGRALYGPEPDTPVHFLEHGIRFTADIVRGQKTGFFLDQRENRLRVQKYISGRQVLNVFGYSGGFSVYAGIGGAAHVTTVDTAQPALDTATIHWTMNDLPEKSHTVVCADAFDFLSAAKRENNYWDAVILDPPSFAPSKEALPKAAGASVTISDGILAVGSCSSHVNLEDFMGACEGGISKARKQATILGIYSQPADHPAPLAMPEFRYLKFIIMRVNG